MNCPKCGSKINIKAWWERLDGRSNPDILGRCTKCSYILRRGHEEKVGGEKR